MLREMNHTFIVLIPKSEKASTVNQFRPISLCNVIYKAISKILANRLKEVLPKIISPWQAGFVPGRTIQENSIVAQELVHSMKHKKGKKGLVAIKVDMEKAYDKMEWCFLEKVMRCFGFNDKWINWVMQCISTVSFSILINGGPMGFFNPMRGLRQGDPLSPFLFILGAEVLSRLIQKAEESGAIHGIKAARGCQAISHLQFVDDLLIFSQANQDEMGAVM